ncbi:MAG: alpha/beta fold hydrolase [Chromatiaceae bacterium]|nr:alpha/beta fold hydrolase [Chromatiaceae bacterium]
MSGLPYALQYAVGQLSLTALSNQQVTVAPVLCLHGWLDNAASFIPLAQHLTDIPLVALEFAGHGHSSHRSADARYYFFDHVEDIVQLCRQQGWQQLTIIGHSMGAMVATALAASFPELVQRLVLIDSLGFVTNIAANAAKQLRDGINSRLKAAARMPCYVDLTEAAMARQKQSDFSLTEALLLAERGTVAKADGLHWRADMRLRHSSVYRLTPEQGQALAAAVSCQVLAIAAKDSAFYPNVQHWARYYPKLTLETVSGGHHCHMTQAAVVAQHIEGFLLA